MNHVSRGAFATRLGLAGPLALIFAAAGFLVAGGCLWSIPKPSSSSEDEDALEEPPTAETVFSEKCAYCHTRVDDLRGMGDAIDLTRAGHEGITLSEEELGLLRTYLGTAEDADDSGDDSEGDDGDPGADLVVVSKRTDASGEVQVETDLGVVDVRVETGEDGSPVADADLTVAASGQQLLIYVAPTAAHSGAFTVATPSAATEKRGHSQILAYVVVTVVAFAANFAADLYLQEVHAGECFPDPLRGDPGSVGYHVYHKVDGTGTFDIIEQFLAKYDIDVMRICQEPASALGIPLTHGAIAEMSLKPGADWRSALLASGFKIGGTYGLGYYESDERWWNDDNVPRVWPTAFILSYEAPGGDRDADGVLDTADKCPDVYDPNQADGDGDGTGDACDAQPHGAFAFYVGNYWDRPMVPELRIYGVTFRDVATGQSLNFDVEVFVDDQESALVVPEVALSGHVLVSISFGCRWVGDNFWINGYGCSKEAIIENVTELRANIFRPEEVNLACDGMVCPGP